jgi:hypothetical protein
MAAHGPLAPRFDWVSNDRLEQAHAERNQMSERLFKRLINLHEEARADYPSRVLCGVHVLLV